jgi:8-oxo-dGTP diphosphatase
MRSSSVPDSDGSGDPADQYTGDPVWPVRGPGAGAAPGPDRAGVRREHDHQPDAPAAGCVAPCAFAAVRDITGRLLLVRRCDTGDWELPGGHVDPGESASDAAVWETAEESCITVEVTGLVGLYTDPGHVIADPGAGLVRQPFAVCFHARPLNGSPGGDQVETSDALPDLQPRRAAFWPLSAGMDDALGGDDGTAGSLNGREAATSVARSGSVSLRIGRRENICSRCE